MRLRRWLLLWLGVLVASGCRFAGGARPAPVPARATLCDVYFSPKGGCTAHVVSAIDGATEVILVQAYAFTSQAIAEALVRAQQRGVRVEAILDKSQRHEHDSKAALLHRAGVRVLIDAAHAIAHNKVMVIDHETVITGSFNFTNGAEERNAENLLLLRDHDVAAKYEANWRAHRSHAQPL